MSEAKPQYAEDKPKSQRHDQVQKQQQEASQKLHSKKSSVKNGSKKSEEFNLVPTNQKKASLKGHNVQELSQRQWNAEYNNQNFILDEKSKKQLKISVPSEKKTDQKVQAEHKSSGLNVIQWEAAYVDDKFYLSDPASLAKLRQLEMQIQKQRKKLINIEAGEKMDHSFLSQRQLDVDGDNSRQECLTEINESKLLQRKNNAEDDLVKEEQKYRNKIQEMRKRKSVLKKEIGCGTNDKNLQVNQQQILRNDPKSNVVEKSALKSSKQKESNIQQIQQQKKIEGLRKQSSASVKNQSVKPVSVHNKPEFEVQKQISKKQSIKKSNSQISPQKSDKKHKEQVKQKSQKSKSKDKTEQIELLNLPQLSVNQKSVKSEIKNKSVVSSAQKSIHMDVPQCNTDVQIINKSPASQRKSNAPSQKDEKIEKKSSAPSKKSQVRDNGSQAHNQQSPTLNKSQKQKSQISNKSSPQKKQLSVVEAGQGQKQKSRKSSQVQKALSSASRPQKDEKQYANQKKSQKLQSQSISKPQIKIHTLSFKKTDKSVQWEQPDPSITDLKFEKTQKAQKSVSEFKMVSQKPKLQESRASHKVQGSLKAQSRNKDLQQKKSMKQNSIKSPTKSKKSSQMAESHLHEETQNKFSLKEDNQEDLHNLTQNQESRRQNSELNQSKQVSDKKRASFKIHSRESSVKSKKSHSRPSSFEKRKLDIEAQQKSLMQAMSNKKSFAQSNHSGPRESEVKANQLQIKKLNEQIIQLQQKLKRVQQKQDQIAKYQNLQSKVMAQDLEGSNAGSGSEPASPLGKMTLTSKLKLQAKLSLEGSTVQFNTYQQKMKRTAQDNEKLQKLKLQQEIGRLKKIIRDMQMQKIKSIEYEQNQSLSKVQFHKPSILDQENNRSRISQRLKDSLNSDMLQTKRNQWNASLVNKQQTGKIKKNSPAKYYVDSPRKYNKLNAEKGKQFSEIAVEDEREQEPLPLRRKAQSVQGAQTVGARSRDLTKSDLINKFEENERNFNQFIQSSRLLVQEPQSYVDHVNNSVPEAYEHKNESQLSPSDKNASPPAFTKTVTRNFSEIIEKMKHQNPESEITPPNQITVGNITMPNLSEPPNISVSQDDLLELAKKTYNLFGINIDEDQNQLCMKKYKNCVVFTFGNNQQQTILWHYSGKFYFGGWKNTSDPGEGEKVGEGIEYIPGKHIYKGQFLGGKKNGNGILKMTNGNIYDGQWVDGIKNGRGVYYQASTGTYYNGEWRDGKRDGYGILRFSNNQFYEGTFSKSIKQGFGAEKFANGDYYKGQYQKGKFHGKGKYCWSNGSSYEGNFVQGCRHGQGNWKSSRKAGDIYIGEYENDKKCGYGRYVWANGCVYEGYFKNDLKNGKGRLVYQDGKQIKGMWQDGNLVSADQQARKSHEHEEEPLRRSIRASSLKNTQGLNQSTYRRPALL